MSQVQVKWRNTSKRFVAFMDIMGFKDLVFRNTHKDVLKIMHNFQPAISVIDEDAQKKLNTRKKGKGEYLLPGKSIVRPFSFSDSIILVSSDDSADSAHTILFLAKWVITRAMLEGIAIKGAIAHGQQTADFDNNIHFGRPLIDAYELQNELLLYGIVLHHTMERYLVDIGMIRELGESYLQKYPIPMKSGDVTHYIVDWTNVFDKRKLKSTLSRLYGNVSGSARQYVDNTVNFIELISRRHEELVKQKKHSASVPFVKSEKQQGKPVRE